MNGSRRKEVYFVARAKTTPKFDIPTLPEFKIEYEEEVEPEPPPKPLVLIIVVTRHTFTEEELALLNLGLLVPEEESEVIDEEEGLEEEEAEVEGEEEEVVEDETEVEEETEESEREVFGDVIDRYITLIESTYPEGIIEKYGVQPGDPEEKWLTQNEFFNAVSNGKWRLASLKTLKRGYEKYFDLHPEAYGYDQIHILGHGGPLTGLLFARETGLGWASFAETEDMGNASDIFPLNPAGKVIIAVCQAKYGTMEKWMGENLHHYRDEYDTLPGLREEPPSAEDVEREAKERVLAVAGDFGVTYTDKEHKPKGWEWHYGTRQVARFLGIEMNMEEVSEAIRAELNEILKSLGKPLVSD